MPKTVYGLSLRQVLEIALRCLCRVNPELIPHVSGTLRLLLELNNESLDALVSSVTNELESTQFTRIG